MTFARNNSGAPIRRANRMTLVEIMVVAVLGGTLLAMVLSIFIFAQGRLKSARSQILYQSQARYATQRLTREIQNARSVSSYRGGDGVYLINPDESTKAFYYLDADGDPNTVEDNAIWEDPAPETSGNERILIPWVTRLGAQAIFANEGSGVSIAMHIGDPGPVTPADAISGKGYQGVQIQVVAKPRNVGHAWTSTLMVNE